MKRRVDKKGKAIRIMRAIKAIRKRKTVLNILLLIIDCDLIPY